MHLFEGLDDMAFYSQWRARELCPVVGAEDESEALLFSHDWPAQVARVQRHRENLVNQGAGVTRAVAGALLASAPSETDLCSVADPESDGFFDWCDIPPWDTWVVYLPDEELPHVPWRADVLICWVPEHLIELVHAGIEVIPTQPAWRVDDAQLHAALDARFDAWGLPAVRWVQAPTVVFGRGA